MRSLSLRNPIHVLAVALIVGATVLPMTAADEKSRLIVQVMTEQNKKPVASAHVIVRFVSGKKLFIKDKKTSWEAQTNRRGELIMDDIPLGRVKIQVIAKGYQTHGEEFEISKLEENLTILLKPPAKQVSAY
ncbi:MAG: hypothetical protein HYX72_11230 [Acidobacteria bacterium]|nr:hypothetical protein [Acidobacteriota bacterium]